MCCGMSNFIVQHTAIYCCIVVLITFALCTVLFIFYAVQANQFCCMFCFYRYQNTWFLTLQFTWYWTWLSFSVIPVVGSDLIEQVRLSHSSVIDDLRKYARSLLCNDRTTKFGWKTSHIPTFPIADIWQLLGQLSWAESFTVHEIEIARPIEHALFTTGQSLMLSQGKKKKKKRVSACLRRLNPYLKNSGTSR